MIRLSSVLSDVFGKSGMMLLTGIINGMQLNDIIPTLPKRAQEKKDKIIEVLGNNISKDALLQIKVLLDVIRCLDEQELLLKNSELHFAYKNYPREKGILMSVPGIEEIGAATLIAEIGDFNDFPSGDKLARWLGMVPNVPVSRKTSDREHNETRFGPCKMDIDTNCSCSSKMQA